MCCIKFLKFLYCECILKQQKEIHMKKISILSVVAALTLPAFAEEKTPAVEETASQEVVAQYEQQFEQPVAKTEKASNPKIKFPHGLQLGVGVSPTSGLNAFVGYNNKNFDSFWAKRFGIRFDFATYSPIKSKLNKKINNEIGDEGFEIEDALKIDNFKLDAKHYGAMIDFYPFGNTWFLGGWRLSGGYFAGKLDLDADIHGTYDGGKIEFELDGKKYSYDGSEMHGKAMIDWKYSGPYAGTGFDLGLLGALRFISMLAWYSQTEPLKSI